MQECVDEPPCMVCSGVCSWTKGHKGCWLGDDADALDKCKACQYNSYHHSCALMNLSNEDLPLHASRRCLPCAVAEGNYGFVVSKAHALSAHHTVYKLDPVASAARRKTLQTPATA